MGLNFSGVPASVTISGAVNAGLPTPASTQTAYTANVSTINGTQTILTATAGKTAYVTDIFFCLKATNGSRTVTLNANGSAITEAMYISNAGTEATGWLSLKLTTPIEVTAGNTLSVTCAGTEVGVFVSYYEA